MGLSNAGPSPVEVDPIKQMELLDSFPPEIRRIVRIAPVCLDMEQLRDALGIKKYKRGFPAGLVEKLIAAIKSNYPDWDLNVRRI